jgi:hypothetical protein
MLLVFVIVASWLAVVCCIVAVFRIGARGDEAPPMAWNTGTSRGDEDPPAEFPRPAVGFQRRLYAVNRS